MQVGSLKGSVVLEPIYLTHQGLRIKADILDSPKLLPGMRLVGLPDSILRLEPEIGGEAVVAGGNVHAIRLSGGQTHG